MKTINDNTLASACYDNNSIDELETAISIGPDTTDMKNWGISRDEWLSEVKLALEVLKRG